jgi:2-octaprenylphenol hydroxylase
MALDDRDFAHQLRRAFEDRLGTIEAVAPRHSFPLRQRHAIDYTRPGMVLVGDAAHSIHPLAGQGINLGLMDVKVLAQELLRAQHRGLGLGERAVLERYQRRRKGANLTMMAAMEGLKHLFAQRALSVRWLRNTGMHWLDRSPALKRQLMLRAMGL